MIRDTFKEYNKSRQAGSYNFTKKSFLAMSFLFFGIFIFGFILLTFGFSQIDFSRLATVSSPAISIGFLVAYLVIFIGYGFFRNRMSFWLFLGFGLAFVSILSLTTAISLALFVQVGVISINQFLLIAIIPAGTMFLAGALGFWKHFPIEKIYPLAILGVFGLLLYSLIGFFVLGLSAGSLGFAILGYVVFFFIAAIDFYYLKSKAKYVEMFGDQLELKTVIRLGVESAISLFFDYIILLRFVIRFIR